MAASSPNPTPWHSYPCVASLTLYKGWPVCTRDYGKRESISLLRHRRLRPPSWDLSLSLPFSLSLPHPQALTLNTASLHIARAPRQPTESPLWQGNEFWSQRPMRNRGLPTATWMSMSVSVDPSRVKPPGDSGPSWWLSWPHEKLWTKTTWRSCP